MSESVDVQFQRRVQSGIQTVKKWQNLPQSFLTEIRNSILLQELMSPSSKYHRKDDDLWKDKDDKLLKRLTLYFQKEMTWMNQPKCDNCGFDKTVSVGMRGPESEEEKSGEATRVEVYNCPQCNQNTTFPRYNNPISIYKNKKGRCGEYANLFGVYCLALGYDQVRYILDSTDHVWVEVYSLSGKYIMCDSCEGLIDKNSMYEKGWGKKLNYIIGFSVVCDDTIQAIDVTKRYTRKFNDMEMQQRRRTIVSSEGMGETILERFNSYKRHVNDNGNSYLIKRCKDVYSREVKERLYLQQCGLTNKWDEEQVSGRISGDLLWRASRGELGNQTKSSEEKEMFSPILFVLPNTKNDIEIKITPEQSLKQSAIVVGNIPCAIGSKGYNVTILDERNGCILQSIVGQTAKDVTNFMDTIPIGRIIIIALLLDEYGNNEIQPMLSKYFGIQENNEFYGFIGQVGYKPSWMKVLSTADTMQTTLELKNQTKLKLHTTKYLPNSISCRAPTDTKAMSLEEKQDYFKTIQKDYIGYVTKENEHMYLIKNKDVYPWSVVESSWSTNYLLPEELVPQAKEISGINVPINYEYFTSLFQTNQVLKQNTTLPIEQALKPQTRIIGLYFSAHWCPPCKRYTPMLIEFYESIKETRNEFEIIFISSDRDMHSFQEYYNSMPWLALPLNQFASQMISNTFSIRGIPNFIVLDSISGNIISKNGREEVTNVCRRGYGFEDLIDVWLDNVPDESLMIMETLKLSVEEGTDDEYEKQLQSFLCKKEQSMEERVKVIFTKLTQDGVDPSKAAIDAIQQVAKEDAEKKNAHEVTLSSKHDEADTNNIDIPPNIPKEIFTQAMSIQNLKPILTTLSKYIQNCINNPHYSKYRHFKISNKVLDRDVVSKEGSVDLMKGLGFDVMIGEEIVVKILLGCDLEESRRVLGCLMDYFK